MEAPSDPLERLMQAFECSLCSQMFRDAVCFPTTCGHYFCRECVIATLEGPGISKSECPVCHKPGWKNDLKVSYTVNNALVHAASLREEVQRGREAEARLRQQRGSRAQPSSPVAAGGLSRPGSAGLAAAIAAGPRSHAEAGGSVGKRKRRGRSVPEQQVAGRAGAEEERRQQQTAQQQPANQQPANQPGNQEQQEGKGWRERQPQRLWGGKKAAPSAAARAQGKQQQPSAAPLAAPPAADSLGAAAQAEATTLAATQGAAGQRHFQQAAAPSNGGRPGIEAPESPVPVLYDSHWEGQARAAPLGPATPEAIAALEAEVALLQQAIQLCDELRCLGGSQWHPQQPAEPAAAEDSVRAAGPAGTAAQALPLQQQQQAGSERQDVMIVPDTQDCGLLPSPLQPARDSAAASPGPEAAGAAVGRQADDQQQHGLAAAQLQQPLQAQQVQQRQRQQNGHQPPWQQDERRQHLGELGAVQKQQRTLQAGLTQEIDDEDGHRMSGRKRRKGGSGRAAPCSSLLGRPGDAAVAKASTGTGAPVEDQPAVQQAQQQAQREHITQVQQGVVQPPVRLSKAAVGENDAVEVMWQADGRLVPFVGLVLEVLPEGKHRIEYLDGEVATQDLDEEQWRLMLQEEYDAAEAEFARQQQQASGSSSGGTSASGEEYRGSSSDEGAPSGSQLSGSKDGVSSPAGCSPGLTMQPHGTRQRAFPPARKATATAVAAAAQQASSTSPAAIAVAPQPPTATAAPVRPKPAPAPPAADPYAFVTNTEAATDDGQLLQAAVQHRQPAALPEQVQQPQQGARQRPQPKQHVNSVPARTRPLVPPPKFGQEPLQQPQQRPKGSEQQMPVWLQHAAAPGSKLVQPNRRQQAAEAAGQQQFGRKRKEAASSLRGQPASSREGEDDAAAWASVSQHSAQVEQEQQPHPQQQPPLRRARLHERPSMHQRRRRRADLEEEGEAAQQHAAALTVAAADVPSLPRAMGTLPSTQDAAGALFSMLQEQPVAQAADVSRGGMAALPLQRTSKHNAAGEGGFVLASQLPLASGWDAGGAAAEHRQRRQQQRQPAAAEQGRASGKVVQDPGLFGLPPAARGSGRSTTRLQDPGLFSQSSEGTGPSVSEAAAAGGAPAAGAAAAAQAGSGQAVGFADLFAGATPAQAAWCSPPVSEGEMESSEVQAAAAVAAGAPGGGARRCIAVSGLNNEIQQKLLTLRGRLGGLTLEEQVTKHTTHVLVPMDDRGCVRQRSMQYLLALAHGCWVLGHGWVDACLEAGQWLPERLYEARGLVDMKGSMLVPAAARQRHAPGGSGGPALFAGRRIFLTAPPPGSSGGRAGSTGTAGKAALVSQMVAAEGGSLVRALGQGEGGRGASSPSPSPEGATLLVCLAQGPQEARAALRMAQKRYPGRPMHHQSWIFDSMCCGRCLDPADYVMTEQRPLPVGARLSLSQQPSQAAGASQGA